jgi:hypothetical protein
MKKITFTLLVLCICATSFAQKTVTFNGNEIEVKGDLITTLHKTYEGKGTGKKELYSHFDELWGLYSCLEINYDSKGNIEAIYSYNANLSNIDKDKCYATELNSNGYEEKQLFNAKIGMKPGNQIVVKSQIGLDKDWSFSKEPIAQIYFSSKALAENFIELLKTKLP